MGPRSRPPDDRWQQAPVDPLTSNRRWHRCPGKQDGGRRRESQRDPPQRDEGKCTQKAPQKKRGSKGPGTGSQGAEVPEPLVAWARVGSILFPLGAHPGSHPRLPQTQKEAPVRVKQAMGTCDASESENGTQKLSGPSIFAMKEFTEDIQADNPGGTGGEGGEGPGDA
ncbi:hypothetical protein GWK47_029402 [Chionoecetes opilio]|uniref:Uncharacterized protein n=1 Tax=Chionoecetes opilio TaxID=41210 RepID=A0A8J5D214_CHIOP|nr:hypothetical protein GWK47_029402 [Chionoecetes opilio]